MTKPVLAEGLALPPDLATQVTLIEKRCAQLALEVAL